MNRRSPSDALRTAAWMAILSAVMAFVVVSVGEASANSRKARGELTKLERATVVSPGTAAASGKPVRVVYPAMVVSSR